MNPVAPPGRPLHAAPACEKQAPALYSFLWLLPLAFVVHDGEEVLTMASWIQSHTAVLQQVAARGPLAARVVEGLPHHMAEVGVAVLFELLIVVAATVLAARGKGRGAGLFFYSAVLGGFTLHVLTHLLQALWLGGYTPGVVTALVVIPPASFFIYRRLHQAGGLSFSRALLHALCGGVLLLPVVLAAHYMGRALLAR